MGLPSSPKSLARDGQRRAKTKRQSTVHKLQTSKQTTQKSVLSTRRAESTQTTKRSSPPGNSQKGAQENRQRLFAAAKSCARTCMQSSWVGPLSCTLNHVFKQ